MQGEQVPMLGRCWYVCFWQGVHVSGSPSQMNPGGHVKRPESTASEAARSVEVQTTTPFCTCAPDWPMVSPLIVTVKLEAGSVAESVVMVSDPRFVGVTEITSP